MLELGLSLAKKLGTFEIIILVRKKFLAEKIIRQKSLFKKILGQKKLFLGHMMHGQMPLGKLSPELNTVS